MLIESDAKNDYTHVVWSGPDCSTLVIKLRDVVLSKILRKGEKLTVK